jgi:hypothetical protein
MSRPEAWVAVEHLAGVWRQSPVIHRLLANLPDHNDSQHGVPEALRNIQAGTGIITSHPLITLAWEAMAAQMPFVKVDGQVTAFFRSVLPAGYAAEASVAWVRSHLLRFPTIPAPPVG